MVMIKTKDWHGSYIAGLYTIVENDGMSLGSLSRDSLLEIKRMATNKRNAKLVDALTAELVARELLGQTSDPKEPYFA